MSIWGHIIDPAVSRGYKAYVYTNDDGRYYLKNVKLWRMRERIEGFDLRSGYTTYHVCLGDVAWIYIGRSTNVSREKFWKFEWDEVSKSTTCEMHFDKDTKLEGEVKLLSGKELILKGMNRSGGLVSINIADIYQIIFAPWKPEDSSEFH